MYRMTMGNVARVLPCILYAVLLFSLCILPGCIEMGVDEDAADAASPVRFSASQSPFQASHPVFTPSGLAVTSTPNPGTVGTIENAEPIPPTQAVKLSNIPSTPRTIETGYPDEMPTATFFENTYKLMYNNVAVLATVERAPFVIEFWTSASSKNPYDALVVITVRDPVTGDVLAEDGYNGQYSSDSYKRITIRDSGQFHVNIYGMRAAVQIRMSGGINEQEAEPSVGESQPGTRVIETEIRAAESSTVSNNEGSALLAAGQPVQALAVFNQGIALAPSYTPLRVNRGLALIELGRPEDALLSLDIAIDQEPYSPDAWIYRGDACVAMQDYPEAVESYTLALELDPDLVSVWEQKGDTLLLSGDTNGAREAYSAGLETDPGNVDLQQKLADLPDPFPGWNILLPVAGIACVVLVLVAVVYTRRSRKTDGLAPPKISERKKSSFFSSRRNADSDALLFMEEEKPGFLSRLRRDPGPTDDLNGIIEALSGDKTKTAVSASTREAEMKGDNSETGKRLSILSFRKKPTEDSFEGEADVAGDALMMDGEEVFHFDEGSGTTNGSNEGRLVVGFNRILEQNPDFSSGFRGITLYSLGRYREALEDFDHELELDPGAAGIWILRARVLARLERDQDSLYSCEQALGIEKDNFDAWRQYGFSLRKLGRDQEALHSLDRALSLNPHSAEVWVARGRILHDLSRDHEALQSYDRALGIDPRSSNLWLMRARSLSDLGREEEALSSLEQGITANPENPSLYIWQGRLFHVLGQFGDALTAYDRALTIQPDDARTWEAMGAVLSELGKFRDEAAAYDRALAIDTENPSLYLKRGDALAASEKMEDAVLDYRKARALRPDDIYITQRLGDLLCRTGRRQEGEEVLRPLLEADSDGLEMKKARGNALLSLGEYQRALASFEVILSLDPDDPEAREGVGAAKAALSAEYSDAGKSGIVSDSHKSPLGDEKKYHGRGDVG